MSFGYKAKGPEVILSHFSSSPFSKHYHFSQSMCPSLEACVPSAFLVLINAVFFSVSSLRVRTPTCVEPEYLVPSRSSINVLLKQIHYPPGLLSVRPRTIQISTPLRSLWEPGGLNGRNRKEQAQALVSLLLQTCCATLSKLLSICVSVF